MIQNFARNKIARFKRVLQSSSEYCSRIHELHYNPELTASYLVRTKRAYVSTQYLLLKLKRGILVEVLYQWFSHVCLVMKALGYLFSYSNFQHKLYNSPFSFKNSYLFYYPESFCKLYIHQGYFSMHIMYKDACLNVPIIPVGKFADSKSVAVVVLMFKIFKSCHNIKIFP